MWVKHTSPFCPPSPPISVRVEPAEIFMGDTVRVYIEGGESPFNIKISHTHLYQIIPGSSYRELLLVPVDGWLEKWSVEDWPNDDTEGSMYVEVSDIYYKDNSKVTVRPRLGDVTGNGAITPFDASLVAQALLELVKFSEYQKVVADFDQMVGRLDRVDIWDCINILRYTVGLPIIIHDVASKLSADVLTDAIRILDGANLPSEDDAPIREVLNRVLAESGGGDVLPTKFNLGQNYPNPFNPETTISYDVVAAGNVSVVV